MRLALREAGEGSPVSNQVIEAEAAAQRYSPAQTLASITVTSASATLLGLANHLMVAPGAAGAYRAHATFGQGAGAMPADNPLVGVVGWSSILAVRSCMYQATIGT